MSLALTILTALLAAGTLLPLSRAKAWWVRGWDFPRAQIAALSGGVIVWHRVAGFSGAVDTVVLVIAGAVALYQLAWIWPFTPLRRCEVKSHPPGAPARIVRVVTVNVLQSNRDAARLRVQLREHRPDVLLVLEADHWWQQQLAEFSAGMPHALACPLDNFYGMLLLSRWPLHDARIQFLVEPDKPSMHALVLLPDGAALRLVCLHPAPPSPTENEKSTERDAELILVARSLARERRPTVVMGDLNDVAWSRTTRLFRKISGLLDPRVGRGLFSTFPASLPFLRWPVDHLFISRHFRLAQLRRLRAIGSDHFPVFAELALESGESRNPPALPADPDDRREAREETAAAPAADAVHVPRSP